MAEALEEEAVLLPSSEGHHFGFLGLIIATVPPFLYAHRNFPQDTTIELGVKCVFFTVMFWPPDKSTAGGS